MLGGAGLGTVLVESSPELQAASTVAAASHAAKRGMSPVTRSVMPATRWLYNGKKHALSIYGPMTV